MFQYSPLDDIITTFSEYLMQRFGGPQYYTDNKGINSPSFLLIHSIIHLLNYSSTYARDAEFGPST